MLEKCVYTKNSTVVLSTRDGTCAKSTYINNSKFKILNKKIGMTKENCQKFLGLIKMKETTTKM